MKLLSVLIEVYNEEQCLPYCLESILPFTDECILIDGSENGPSIDKTSEIIEEYKQKYPDKITYVQGTYRRDDGAWDDTVQSNEGFKRVTGKFVMRTHADIIYDYDDMEKLRGFVEKFQEDKKVFYCPLVEFFYDTRHIRLYPDSKYEEMLVRPIVGDLPVVSMELNPHFEDIGKYRRSSLVCHYEYKDLCYMPHIKRFHFGWVKPFEHQVLKHVRYIKRGDHEEHGEELKAQGEYAIIDWAIKHVMSYKHSPSMYDYAGEYPDIAEPIRDMCIMDGYKKFMAKYNEKLFWVNNHES